MHARTGEPRPQPRCGPGFRRVLSDDDALAIRQYARAARKQIDRRRLPRYFIKRLAALYGVSEDTIKRIIHRETYRHVILGWKKWGR